MRMREHTKGGKGEERAFIVGPHKRRKEAHLLERRVFPDGCSRPEPVHLSARGIRVGEREWRVVRWGKTHSGLGTPDADTMSPFASGSQFLTSMEDCLRSLSLLSTLQYRGQSAPRSASHAAPGRNGLTSPSISEAARRRALSSTGPR